MYVTIDLGGSNTRIASSTDLTTLHKVVRTTTQKGLTEQKKLITDAVIKVTEGSNIEAICVGVPGLIDRQSDQFGNIVNYPIISNTNYAALFDESLHSSKIIGENDAALAGLGEAVFGAGKTYKTVCYLTLSTGVGGVVIQNGILNRQQKHYEPGHHIMIAGGLEDTKLNLKGTMDAYLSGDAFLRNYGISPKECEDKEIWKDYGEKLAIGIINIMAFWAPDIIVIGGGVSNKFERYYKEPLQNELSKQNAFSTPTIVTAELKDDAGLYGGFALIKQISAN